VRIAFISVEGCGLSWARRLYEEGREILFYVVPGKNGKDPMKITNVGTGLIPKTNNLSELLMWAKEKPCIAFFDSSRAGPIAERFRMAGIPVIGGGTFCDRLEEDRLFGEKIAKEIGCKIPETKAFATITQTLAFAKGQPEDAGWHFKSDSYKESDATQGTKTAEQLVAYLEYVRKAFGDRIPNILQRTMEGVALSTACWFNGTDFVPPFEGTIEHKKFMPGDIGPSTGCSINVVWYYDAPPPIVEQLGWDKLAALFRKYKAPPALYDINTLCTDDGPYFLEFTPRNGWDSEAVSPLLWEAEMGFVLEGLAMGRLAEIPVSTRDISYGIRLSIGQYPWEHDDDGKRSSMGVPLLGPQSLWGEPFQAYNLCAGPDGTLQCADRTGLLGVAVARKRTLKKAHEAVVEYIKEELWAPGIQWRNDGDKTLHEDAEALEKMGYVTHPGL
jgi:phosphoribosylamine-glycine ligase